MGRWCFLDIEIYDMKDNWEQERFLVHGYDDVFWTDSIEDAVNYIKRDLERIVEKIRDE